MPTSTSFQLQQHFRSGPGHNYLAMPDPIAEEIVYDSQPPNSSAIDLNFQEPTPASSPILDTGIPPANINVQGSGTTSASQPQAKRRGRPPSTGQTKDKPSTDRFHWDVRNTTILIEAKTQYDDRRFHAGVAEKSQTIEEQWEEIAGQCAQRHFHVDWKIAYEKWRLTSGRQNQSTSPIANAGSSPQSSSVADGGDDISTFDRTPNNGGVSRKARKRTHQLDVGLREASRDMTQVMEEAEEGRRARRGESLQGNFDGLLLVQGSIMIASECLRECISEQDAPQAELSKVSSNQQTQLQSREDDQLYSPYSMIAFDCLGEGMSEQHVSQAERSKLSSNQETSNLSKQSRDQQQTQLYNADVDSSMQIEHADVDSRRAFNLRTREETNSYDWNALPDVLTESQHNLLAAVESDDAVLDTSRKARIVVQHLLFFCK
ncbi:hypothetical protein L7F22_069423 [Adiantum nelumboides]|nr:hypothetical protein [Adiantum nelumboides]